MQTDMTPAILLTDWLILNADILFSGAFDPSQLLLLATTSFTTFAKAKVEVVWFKTKVLTLGISENCLSKCIYYTCI